MMVTIEDRNIKPIIDSVYGFQDAKDAFKNLSKGAFGKIVIGLSS